MFFFDWEGNFILNFWLGFVGLVLFFKEDNDGICLLIDLIFIIRFFICLFSLVKCWVWLIVIYYLWIVLWVIDLYWFFWVRKKFVNFEFI